MLKKAKNTIARVGLLLLLAACKHPPPPPIALPPPLPCTAPEPLSLMLVASQRLNPGDDDVPLATTVRIYQLKDALKLSEASLDQILDEDRALLSEDALSIQEFTLYPGERIEPNLVRKEGATVLGVVALFRRPLGTSWRAIRNLPPPNPDYCHVSHPENSASRSLLKFYLDENRIEAQWGNTR